MKIVVISDSHGNISNLKHVIGFAKRIKAGAIIHCGDWNSVAVVQTVLDYKIPVYSVLGNADIDPKMAKIYKRTYLELILDNKKIGIIHSIKDLKSDTDQLDILFYGHTHKQNQKENIVNPGALENDINFAVYDTKTNKIELIHE